MIAAIAVAHELTLVSNNHEFNRVDGMPVEDWTMK
jgi:predicted nucleic acid-binding protein